MVWYGIVVLDDMTLLNIALYCSKADVVLTITEKESQTNPRESLKLHKHIDYAKADYYRRNIAKESLLIY